MTPRIYRHAAAGWCLAMPGHDPIELPSWHAAVELLRQLDDRRPAVTPRAPVDEHVTVDDAVRPAHVMRRWRLAWRAG